MCYNSALATGPSGAATCCSHASPPCQGKQGGLACPQLALPHLLDLHLLATALQADVVVNHVCTHGQWAAIIRCKAWNGMASMCKWQWADTLRCMAWHGMAWQGMAWHGMMSMCIRQWAAVRCTAWTGMMSMCTRQARVLHNRCKQHAQPKLRTCPSEPSCTVCAYCASAAQPVMTPQAPQPHRPAPAGESRPRAAHSRIPMARLCRAPIPNRHVSAWSSRSPVSACLRFSYSATSGSSLLVSRTMCTCAEEWPLHWQRTRVRCGTAWVQQC